MWLGTDGATAGVQAPGLPALSDLYDEFVANGGQVWLCGACTKPRAGFDDFTLYPLFTDDLIGLMRSLIPPERQAAVATAVVCRPNARNRPARRTSRRATPQTP